jgi:hypothetical protein
VRGRPLRHNFCALVDPFLLRRLQFQSNRVLTSHDLGHSGHLNLGHRPSPTVVFGGIVHHRHFGDRGLPGLRRPGPLRPLCLLARWRCPVGAHDFPVPGRPGGPSAFIRATAQVSVCKWGPVPVAACSYVASMRANSATCQPEHGRPCRTVTGTASSTAWRTRPEGDEQMVGF